MSMGLATDAPGNNCDFNSSAFSPSILGTCKSPLDNASVNITPGPPACVTMANLLMFNRGSDGDGFILSVVFSNVENMQPTVVSSSREKHLTIPALRNKASTAESLEAIAPVCDDAALLPLSLAPALIAAMRQPLRINELAWKSNLSGLEMFSMYKSLTWESFSASNFSSIYCNTSSMPICLPFPIDQTEWNGNPLITADSRINTAVAPEPDIKSTPLGLSCGMGCVKTL